MSQVLRYTPSLKPGLMIEDAEGKWAKYEVLAQVIAEREAAQETLSRWHALNLEREEREDNLRTQLAERDALLLNAWECDIPSPLKRDIRAALSTAATPEACDHEWVDARNKYVKNGELCVKCGAIRSGNQTTDGAKPEADHE